MVNLLVYLYCSSSMFILNSIHAYAYLSFTSILFSSQESQWGGQRWSQNASLSIWISHLSFRWLMRSFTSLLYSSRKSNLLLMKMNFFVCFWSGWSSWGRISGMDSSTYCMCRGSSFFPEWFLGGNNSFLFNIYLLVMYNGISSSSLFWFISILCETLSSSWPALFGGLSQRSGFQLSATFFQSPRGRDWHFPKSVW